MLDQAQCREIPMRLACNPVRRATELRRAIMKRLGVTALLLLAGLASAGAVEQAGLLEEGRRIAREACSQCHLVDGAGKSALPAPKLPGPTFAAVAAMSSTTSVAIKVFLKTPHANMPDIILSEAEIDALAVYILSLRRR
jgi:mono/diheme cytochrome c family protein